jgi:hypothetical protein
MTNLGSRGLASLSAIALSLLLGCGEKAKCAICGGAGGEATTTATDTNDGGSGGTGGGTATSTTFPCKGLTCKKGADYCKVTTQLSQNDSGECASLPLTCLDPDADCSCFVDLMGCLCEKQPTGELAVFCDIAN